jgi:hypothetical protein
LIFHIGPEMVECLMRKAQAAESKQDTPATHFRRKRRGKDVAKAGRITPYHRIVETVASALFLILRWLL